MKMIVFFALSALLLLASCARQISSDVYASGQVGEVSMTYPGIVRNVREVLVENGEQLEDNGLGIAGGGMAGGIIGNAVGRGNFAPTVFGAIAGAAAGTFVEKKLKEQAALEYVVQMDNGSLMTVVQGRDRIFNIGQLVYVIVSQSGRSRISSQ